MLLNHTLSPVRGVNAQVATGTIDERIRVAYVTILSAITAVCEQQLGRHLPILAHGYDDPVPAGRGFRGGPTARGFRSVTTRFRPRPGGAAVRRAP